MIRKQNPDSDVEVIPTFKSIGDILTMVAFPSLLINCAVKNPTVTEDPLIWAGSLSLDEERHFLSKYTKYDT